MKKTAMRESLNNVNALRPNVFNRDFFSEFLFTGHSGRVSEKMHSISEKIPDAVIWVNESCMGTPPIFSQLVSSILQMKPTVPKARMGGKALTVSIPARDKA